MNVEPVITGTGEIRRASSSCHGAKLDIGGEGTTRYWLCRECKQPCDRVMSDPEEVKIGE